MAFFASEQMNNTPLVTVGIASYNNGRYITETLDSIYALDYPSVELIVVDDASSDDSVAVIEAWLAQHPGYNGRLIAHPSNKGICPVCNRLISEARGKYVCMIGSDDLYLPQKLAVQVAILEAAAPDVGVVYSDVSTICPDGSVLVPSLYATGQPVPSVGDIWLPMLRVNFIPAMTTLIRRDCYDVVGLYDENLAYEDWDMWLRLSRKFKFLYQPEVTALYRVHGGSVTYTRRRQMNESSCALLQKQVGVSPEGDAVINEHLAKYAELLYFQESPRSRHWLRERWRHRKDMRGLLLLTFSSLQVPPAWVSSVMRFVRKGDK